MAERRIGIIINGATGRIGTTQHVRSLMDIRADGGLALRNGDRLMPDLLLAGRDAGRLAALAAANGGLRWTTDLAAALAGSDEIFMDCSATGGRPALIRRAIAAGKHIHVEKPTATTVAEAMDLARLAAAAGVKHGVIQDKLFLPGFAKLMFLKKSGFFGRIVGARIDAGSWIFDGELQTCQRPSWNYRKADGGGLALDMMAHWRYMIDRLAGPVERVAAQISTAMPRRIDEAGRAYDVDVEDTVHALLTLEGGIPAVISNSWATRVRGDDTMCVQIDGMLGSAVAGRNRCFIQAAANTPEAFAGAAAGLDLRRDWAEVPETLPAKPPFRQCWELFLRHVGEDAPYLPTLVEGAKAVQLAELVYRSHAEGRWIVADRLEL
ncbi:MAG: Gfo/Idh/MocA family oxidoreductase [Alphaproteobacteria bacterium]|nr:Gfo/Idh/MocA family oxidoreductase [Alphaproteobacteria bacterium]